MQPKQFKIKPGGFKEIQRKYLLLYTPLMLLAATIGLIIVYFNSIDKPNDFSSLYLSIPVVLLVVGFSFYKSVKRQRALFESFTLVVDDNTLIREQNNTPVISISHNDIREIIKHKNGCISIKTNQSLNTIMIPAQIEHMEELQDTLSGIQDIKEDTSVSLLQKVYMALIFMGMALTGWVFLSDNKLVVTIGGSILTVTLVWCTYVARKSKNIDNKTRKEIWWIGVVLFAIISRIILIHIGG